MSRRDPFSKVGTSTQDRPTNYVGFETTGVASALPSSGGRRQIASAVSDGRITPRAVCGHSP